MQTCVAQCFWRASNTVFWGSTWPWVCVHHMEHQGQAQCPFFHPKTMNVLGFWSTLTYVQSVGFNSLLRFLETFLRTVIVIAACIVRPHMQQSNVTVLKHFWPNPPADLHPLYSSPTEVRRQHSWCKEHASLCMCLQTTTRFHLTCGCVCVQHTDHNDHKE